MKISKEMVSKINSVVANINDLNYEFGQGKDLFRNYKFREFVTANNIQQSCDSSYELLLEKNTGFDFKNSRTDYGEDKSSNNVTLYKVKKNSIPSLGKLNLSKVKFEFDKINDEKKVEKLFDVNSYSFGFFMNNTLQFNAYANCSESVNHINSILKERVAEKLVYFNECKENNKRIARDSILLTGHEVVSCPSIVLIYPEKEEESKDAPTQSFF
jgi:hypothetical protein